LSLAPGPGLTNALAGEADWRSCLYRVPEDGEHLVEGLEVLPGGSPVENPLALLASEAFGHLVRELTQRAESVLIIAPAIGPCTEVWALASNTGTVLMVVDLSKARRRAVRNAVRSVITARAELLGVVCNRVEGVEPSGRHQTGA
jgi:Mrp family chromosome partitioning ATPase